MTNDTTMLQDILKLPTMFFSRPEKLAEHFNVNYGDDPEFFTQLCEISLVLLGQNKLTPVHFKEKQIKQRTQFSLQEQAVMYFHFDRNQNVDNYTIRLLADQLGKSEREIRQWWYNRRSDVRDNTFQIPKSVIPILSTLMSQQQ